MFERLRALIHARATEMAEADGEPLGTLYLDAAVHELYALLPQAKTVLRETHAASPSTAGAEHQRALRGLLAEHRGRQPAIEEMLAALDGIGALEDQDFAAGEKIPIRPALYDALEAEIAELGMVAGVFEVEKPRQITLDVAGAVVTVQVAPTAPGP
jgi:hypothetical protein